MVRQYSRSKAAGGVLVALGGAQATGLFDTMTATYGDPSGSIAVFAVLLGLAVWFLRAGIAKVEAKQDAILAQLRGNQKP